MDNFSSQKRFDDDAAACCSALLSLSNCGIGNCRRPSDNRQAIGTTNSSSSWLRPSSHRAGHLFSRQKDNARGDHDGEESEDFDALIAKEMNSLSLEERDRLSDEINGVSKDSITEDDEFIAQHLQLLDEEIKKLRQEESFRAESGGYEQAMAVNPEYVTNKELRLMFLRADRYKVASAAKRLVQHFQYKLELFGEENLCKQIGLDDLSKEDQMALRSGAIQFLGVHDLKQRTVQFVFPELLELLPVENHLRAAWYQIMVAIEDETFQHHGLVSIIFGRNSNFIRVAGNSIHLARSAYILNKGLPVRTAAVHFNLTENELHPVLRATLIACGRDLRLRFRIHLEDTPVRHLYTLQSFGIDPNTVPLAHDGRPKIEHFLHRIQVRHTEEQKRKVTKSETPEKESQEVIVKPSNMDVLLGKGKQCELHKGNITLSKDIENEIPAYNRAHHKFEKTCVVARVVQRTQELGGRFLYFDKKLNGWVEADDSMIHESTSARFRVRIRKARRSSTASPNMPTAHTSATLDQSRDASTTNHRQAKQTASQVLHSNDPNHEQRQQLLQQLPPSPHGLVLAQPSAQQQQLQQQPVSSQQLQQNMAQRQQLWLQLQQNLHHGFQQQQRLQLQLQLQQELLLLNQGQQQPYSPVSATMQVRDPVHQQRQQQQQDLQQQITAVTPITPRSLAMKGGEPQSKRVRRN